MAAINPVLRTSVPNRRRRVRHKIQTPAYATLNSEPKSAMLDLYEIVDISEEGIAIQCPLPLEADQELKLCLDLADCPDQIFTTGKVIWSNQSGRAGLHFLELPPSSLFRLREWLFMNAMAGVANADDAARAGVMAHHVPPRPSYTDTLAAVSAVQREVEALGADLGAALQLIATRAQSLVRASGAAIALSTGEADCMECRASAGEDAPPVGARLQVGSGFSGECVKTGEALRCDDTEADVLVDRETCRVLGIRSILAVPVRIGQKSVGIIEAFSREPRTFSENDTRVLQRLSETVLEALNRAARAENLPELRAEPEPDPFAPTPGSVLFAANPDDELSGQKKNAGGISLPRAHLILLVAFAITISLSLGYLMAPTIQAKLQQRGRVQLPTVLASSAPPTSEAPAALPSSASLENFNFQQLRDMAEKGDPAAENAVALRYFQGDENAGIKQDEKQAVHWFLLAAEHGNVAAQAKLGFLYWDGHRGLPKDLNKSYLWTMIALGRSDSPKDPALINSKTLTQFLRTQMTREQSTAIEHEAQQWLQQHSSSGKPSGLLAAKP